MSQDCIFCKIITKEEPCFKVYENEHFLGFLDINPLNLGHSLVVPKKHVHWTYDVENFGDYFETARKIALALKEALECDFVQFFTIGLWIPHAHIHVLPRFGGDGHRGLPNRSEFKKFDSKKMQETADKILQITSKMC